MCGRTASVPTKAKGATKPYGPLPDLVGHPLGGPPFVLSVTDGVRVVDAHDYAGEGDILWRCPHEITYALGRRGSVEP